MNPTRLPHDVGGGSAPKILIAIYSYFFFVLFFSALEVKPEKSSVNIFIRLMKQFTSESSKVYKNYAKHS